MEEWLVFFQQTPLSPPLHPEEEAFLEAHTAYQIPGEVVMALGIGG